ncbi:hypothetical protein Bca4012_034698 [Brassica carinata]
MCKYYYQHFWGEISKSLHRWIEYSWREYGLPPPSIALSLFRPSRNTGLFPFSSSVVIFYGSMILSLTTKVEQWGERGHV